MIFIRCLNVKKVILFFVLLFVLVDTLLIYSIKLKADNPVIVPEEETIEIIENKEEIIAEPIQVFEVVEDPIVYYYTEQDIIDIAKVLYRECRGNKSKTEQACVAWVILNRVDTKSSTIHDIVRVPNQFAFHENTPVWDNLYELARDVLERWNSEKNGLENIGRVLPINYLYFHGSDGHNWFKNSLNNYTIWNYSLESPYES